MKRLNYFFISTISLLLVFLNSAAVVVWRWSWPDVERCALMFIKLRNLWELPFMCYCVINILTTVRRATLQTSNHENLTHNMKSNLFNQLNCLFLPFKNSACFIYLYEFLSLALHQRSEFLPGACSSRHSKSHSHTAW